VKNSTHNIMCKLNINVEYNVHDSTESTDSYSICTTKDKNSAITHVHTRKVNFTTAIVKINYLLLPTSPIQVLRSPNKIPPDPLELNPYVHSMHRNNHISAAMTATVVTAQIKIIENR